MKATEASSIVRVDTAALEHYLAAAVRLDDDLAWTTSAVERVVGAVAAPDGRAAVASVHRLLAEWRAADDAAAQVLGAMRAIRSTAGGAVVFVPGPPTEAAWALRVVQTTAGDGAVVRAVVALPATVRGPALRSWLADADDGTVADLVAVLHAEAWSTDAGTQGSSPGGLLRILATALGDAFDTATPVATGHLLDAVGDPITLAWLVDAGLRLPAGAAVATFERWYVPALAERLRTTDPTIGLDPPLRLVAFGPSDPPARCPEVLLDLVSATSTGAAMLAGIPFLPDDDLRRHLGLGPGALTIVDLVDLPVATADGGAAQARLLERLATTAQPGVADRATAVLVGRATGPQELPGALLPAAQLVAGRHLDDLATALALPLHHGSGEPTVVEGRLTLDADDAARLVGRALLAPDVAAVLLPPLTDHLARRALGALDPTPGSRHFDGDWLRSLVGFDDAVAHAAHRSILQAADDAPAAMMWRSVLLAVDVGTAVAAVTGYLPSTLRAPLIAPLHDAARRARTPATERLAAADAVGMGCHQVVALGLATGRFAADDPMIAALGPRFRSGAVLRPWWELDAAERVAFVHVVTAGTASFRNAGLPTPGDVAALHADLTVVLR